MSTANGLRTPLMFALVNLASPAGVHPLFSAVPTVEVSLTPLSGVSIQAEARDRPADTIGPVEPGHWVEADTYLPIKG